jgi:putative transposase
MPRKTRTLSGGFCYHIINRGNGRARVFHGEADYREFVKLMAAAGERLAPRLLAYCLMPNHVHLVLWPREDGEVSRWMQWLMTAQVRRHHRRHGSDGHLWQGRFKAFPIQRDEHLLSVLRYVERNPLRAKLVARAEDWPWSSLGAAGANAAGANAAGANAAGANAGRFEEALAPPLHAGPLPRPANWSEWVNEAEPAGQLAALRHSVNRGTPWGGADWARRTAAHLGIESSLHPRGRPPKKRIR